MRKPFKTIIFTVLACTFLLGAGISAEAVSKPSGVAINDTNFAWAVKKYAKKADTNKNGYLSKKEAEKIIEVRFFNAGRNIDSFKGIKYFTETEDFYYRADSSDTDYDDIVIHETSTAPKINLSGFKKLKKVNIDSRNAYLRKVNLKNCPNLEEVDIHGNIKGCVDDLNLKGCKNLRTLTLYMTDVKKLNLSNLNKLTELSIDDDNDKLKTLNVKGCTNLRTVDIISSSLRHLKLKGAKKLEYFSLAGACSFDSLDFNTNTGLKELHLGYGIYVSDLDLENNLNLKKLRLYDSNITSLKVRNKNLRKLDCHANEKLEEIDVSNCPKLETLSCYLTSLTKLNVKKNVNLRYLHCDNTGLKKLNLRKNHKLEMLKCRDTNIQKLDLSNTRISKPSALKCDPDVTVTYAE